MNTNTSTPPPPVAMLQLITGYWIWLLCCLRFRRRLKPGSKGVRYLTILEVKQLSKHCGGLKAVDQVELSVGRNTVHTLVGPNGSGKTTLLNVLSGIYKPTTGRLFFDGQPVTRLLPHERAGRGIGRTFQNVRLFTSMSILENIIVGAERPGTRWRSAQTA